MPTYEFRCPNGHTFERFYRSIGTSEAQTACPECGQMAERIMSGGAGLVFKGSGFYLTDYGKNAHQKKAPESKSDGAKAEGGKSEGASGTSGGSSESGGASKSSESKPAESKPAAPPKPSSGE
ncbi:MAG: zinc ribbon domain-containing protein [Gemmatimonadetes bacterium]|nr:zinc ribbon domain-containing protein [Gemmatimonadota bacterium]